MMNALHYDLFPIWTIEQSIRHSLPDSADEGPNVIIRTGNPFAPLPPEVDNNAESGFLEHFKVSDFAH